MSGLGGRRGGGLGGRGRGGRVGRRWWRFGMCTDLGGVGVSRVGAWFGGRDGGRGDGYGAAGGGFLLLMAYWRGGDHFHLKREKLAT